jgi:hypothetical protein
LGTKNRKKLSQIAISSRAFHLTCYLHEHGELHHMAITCHLFPKTMLATAIPEGDTTNQISHTTKTQIFGPYACDLGTWTGLAKRTDLEGLHQRSSSRPQLDRRRRPAAARWGQHLCGAMQELGGSAMGCRRGRRRSGILEARPPTTWS